LEENKDWFLFIGLYNYLKNIQAARDILFKLVV